MDFTANLGLVKPAFGETGYADEFATSMDTLDARAIDYDADIMWVFRDEAGTTNLSGMYDMLGEAGASTMASGWNDYVFSLEPHVDDAQSDGFDPNGWVRQTEYESTSHGVTLPAKTIIELPAGRYVWQGRAFWRAVGGNPPSDDGLSFALYAAEVTAGDVERTYGAFGNFGTPEFVRVRDAWPNYIAGNVGVWAGTTGTLAVSAEADAGRLIPVLSAQLTAAAVVKTLEWRVIKIA